MTTHSEPSVLVIGATGKTGRRVTAGLRARDIRVREASRGASEPAARFDWHAEETWGPALEGMAAAYVTYQPDLAVPLAAGQVAALGEAAARAGLSRLVLLSGRGEPAARRAEDALLTAFPRTAVLRCSWFAQNFTEGAFRDAVLAGVIAMPAPPDTREPFLDADDIAACAVELITGPERGGRVFELSGPESLRLSDVATRLAQATARPVAYVQVAQREFAEQLAADGVPLDDALELAATLAEVLDGRNAATTGGVHEVLGRPARSFADFLRTAAADGAFRS